MKNVKKAILLVLSASILVLGSGTTSMAAEAMEPAAVTESPTITPRWDIIEWRYQVIDGHVYRRQYNYTQEKWLGSWERC